jgi:predicted PurR-regulated permease PerM
VSRWEPPLWYDQVAGVSWRFLLAVAAIATVVLALGALDVVVLPVFLALLFASALAPLARRFRDWGARPGLASIGVVVLLIVALLLAAGIALSAVGEQWDNILAALDDGLEELEEELADSTLLDPGQAGAAGDVVREVSRTFARIASAGAIWLLSSLAEVVSTLLLSLFVTFFYLKDGNEMWAWVVARAGGDAQLLDRVGRQAFSALAHYVRGAVVIALIDATFIALGAWLLGVPFAGAIFVLTFFLAFIPYIGAFTAGIFACVLAVAEGGVTRGLAMLAIVILVQVIEGNLLQPIILGKATGLHPMVVALVVVGAGAISGIMGIIVAVPIAASLTAALAELRRSGWFDEHRPAAGLRRPPSP